VLVLNATYEPINVCTVRRATVLLLKEKAEVIEIGSQTLHWANGSLAKPVVIRLITYVKIPRDTHKRKITRRAVFARDGCRTRSTCTRATRRGSRARTSSSSSRRRRSRRRGSSICCTKRPDSAFAAFAEVPANVNCGWVGVGFRAAAAVCAA
jgi:hypothetical protein